MLRVGLGFFGIAAVCFLLLAFNVYTLGPCGGTGVIPFFTMIITAPIGLALIFIATVRHYIRKRKMEKVSA